jgi:ATP-binding cassette, subfamily B, multidrug efflux pump
MREAMAGKTVIAIAHRLSTVMDMDRLIVLECGVIVADGSHEELLCQGGLYAELWRKQSGGFNPVRRPNPLAEPIEVADLEERDLTAQGLAAQGLRARTPIRF